MVRLADLPGDSLLPAAKESAKSEVARPQSGYTALHRSLQFKFVSCSKKSAPEREKQTFDKPKWKGDRLDWCVKPGVGCGKDAADLFCKASAFTKATDFSPAMKIGLQTPTRTIGNNALCNTIICNGFQSITCVAK